MPEPILSPPHAALFPLRQHPPQQPPPPPQPDTRHEAGRGDDGNRGTNERERGWTGAGRGTQRDNAGGERARAREGARGREGARQRSALARFGTAKKSTARVFREILIEIRMLNFAKFENDANARRRRGYGADAAGVPFAPPAAADAGARPRASRRRARAWSPETPPSVEQIIN